MLQVFSHVLGGRDQPERGIGAGHGKGSATDPPIQIALSRIHPGPSAEKAASATRSAEKSCEVSLHIFAAMASAQHRGDPAPRTPKWGVFASPPWLAAASDVAQSGIVEQGVGGDAPENASAPSPTHALAAHALVCEVSQSAAFI